MDNSLSIRFFRMSTICAGLIVVLHSGVSPCTSSMSYYLEQLIRVVCRIAVPWFFLAAGYFLARHFHEDGWWRRETFKRIRSLLVPLWIWTVIGLLLAAIVHCGMALLGYKLQQEGALDILSINGILTLSGLNFCVNMGSLWFVRTLFVFVCLSPLLAWGGRSVFWIRTGVLFLLYFASAAFLDRNSTVWTFFEYGISLRGLFYFSLGMSLRRYPFEMGTKTYFKWICLFISVGLAGAQLLMPSLKDILDVLFVPFALLIAFKVPWCGLEKFAGYSFPVYLMHGLYLTIFSCILGTVGIRTTSLESIGWHFGRAIFAIAGSVVTTFFLRRYLPRFAMLAFGGR